MVGNISRALFALLIVAGIVLVLDNRAAAAGAERPGPLPSPLVDEPLASAKGEQTAVFAGGCFWGIEAVFQHVKGVKSAVSGYTGGSVVSPSYEQVTTGTTGHAEAVRVVYDPSRVTYGQLLRVFFSVAHDPTQLNRQGPDVGTHYRSAIYYASDSQKRVAKAYIDQLTKAKSFPRPIVTEVSALGRFNVAEAYHQDYAAQHPYQPYIMIHDAPKVANLKREFADLYVEQVKR
ncbi:MAG: peptide-methionine (S)-S-oxide reductase MsrA [Gemmatimonadota bacterium]|nr:peptide-methionine (S)-S-oxide reductase MsrA [Gemmatimonadota bacterium]